ncbi:MAG TPA: hypothetical protein VKF35_11145, partial [Hyphomicrobiaceae bacterium]|nr:hypothetical protein [Hyphomicrobiaceae bacterium]
VDVMKPSLLIIVMCLLLGIIYGKIATVLHLYLPPNWLANVIGSHDVEMQMDLAYIGLYIDSIVIGIIAIFLYKFAQN